MKKIPAVLAVLVALPLVALAQKPVTQTDMVELSAKIDAIDQGTRLVTLKDKDGNLKTIYAGPEVKRFDELKVGDTVTFRYYESVAYSIRKPGQPGSAPVSGDPTIARGGLGSGRPRRVKPVHLDGQAVPRDAQEPGRLRAIAVGALERLLDQSPLQLGDATVEGERAVGRGLRCGAGRFEHRRGEGVG